MFERWREENEDLECKKCKQYEQTLDDCK